MRLDAAERSAKEKPPPGRWAAKYRLMRAAGAALPENRNDGRTTE
jgi:hypothetical protein